VTLFHAAWRREVSLLACGALDGEARQAALRHVEGCAACRLDLLALEETLDLVAADPVHRAEPPLAASAMAARVRAAIDRPTPEREPTAGAWRLLAAPALRSAAAAAAVLAALIPLALGPRPGHEDERAVPVAAGPASAPSLAEDDTGVSLDALERLEVHIARRHAARYLSEAQDVLVTLAATSRDCEREGRVDVAEEARRSRELLARRAMLVEMDREAVASARPVLEDVELMLREVASLEACARRGELEAIGRELGRRRLLMKMDLMARELQG
jgi:hypothetical protein